ncbi:MAG: hypothetical protein L6W00_18360 [Lentisphaeria bacterium]|nr:MAG: hypothetical protein L6W00_18360 [Lentisphaeria bacterium]
MIAGTLLSSGRTLTFDPEEADLYVINTCAFLPAAREEAFAAIREAIEWNVPPKAAVWWFPAASRSGTKRAM